MCVCMNNTHLTQFPYTKLMYVCMCMCVFENLGLTFIFALRVYPYIIFYVCVYVLLKRLRNVVFSPSSSLKTYA